MRQEAFGHVTTLRVAAPLLAPAKAAELDEGADGVVVDVEVGEADVGAELSLGAAEALVEGEVDDAGEVLVDVEEGLALLALVDSDPPQALRASASAAVAAKAKGRGVTMNSPGAVVHL